MKTLIFDMDGVLIDSELHWRATENKFMKRLIPTWNANDQKKIVGRTVDDIHQKLAQEYELSITLQGFRDLYDKMAMPIYAEKTQLLPGCRAILESMQKKNVPMALASSARKSWIKTTIRRFDLSPFFKAVVSEEDVGGKGKPDPAIFLKTAELMEVSPSACVVIEDSCNGVLAAKSAGMFCIGLRNGFNQEQDLSKADVQINGFLDSLLIILPLLSS